MESTEDDHAAGIDTGYMTEGERFILAPHKGG